jgi:hypothetical protein
MKAAKKTKARQKKTATSKQKTWLITIVGTIGVLVFITACWAIYRDAISVKKTSRPIAYTCTRTFGHHKPLATGTNDTKSNDYCVHLAQELYNFQTIVVKGQGPLVPAAIAINGKYDKATETAIRQYQLDHPPLKATGTVDFYTWNALEGADAPYDKTPATVHIVSVKTTGAKCPYGQVDSLSGCQLVALAWKAGPKTGDGFTLADTIKMLKPATYSPKKSASLPSFLQSFVDSYAGFVSK